MCGDIQIWVYRRGGRVLDPPLWGGGTAERWVRFELKAYCVSTVFTSSTTFGGPPSPKGKVGERGNEPTDKLQFTIPKKKAPPKWREPLPRRGRMGSATAAAAGEQQDDEDDPDPVVVVEYVAQTVVHSEPPKKYVAGNKSGLTKLRKANKNK